MKINTTYFQQYNQNGQAVVYDFPAPAEHTQRHLDTVSMAAELALLRAENTRLEGEVKDNKGWAIFGKFSAAGIVGTALGIFYVVLGPWSWVCIGVATLLGLTVDKWREERKGKGKGL